MTHNLIISQVSGADPEFLNRGPKHAIEQATEQRVSMSVKICTLNMFSSFVPDKLFIFALKIPAPLPKYQMIPKAHHINIQTYMY